MSPLLLLDFSKLVLGLLTRCFHTDRLLRNLGCCLFLLLRSRFDVCDSVCTTGAVKANVVTDAAKNDSAYCSGSDYDGDLQDREVFLLLFAAAAIVDLEEVGVKESSVQASVVGRDDWHCLRDSVELLIVMLAQTGVGSIARFGVAIDISTLGHKPSSQVPVLLVVEVAD